MIGTVIQRSGCKRYAPEVHVAEDLNFGWNIMIDFDFTEVIAQTNIEMKRLGWTKEHGRNHLLATYGKRSRPRLTDAELLEFLDYLKSQPSPTPQDQDDTMEP